MRATAASRNLRSPSLPARAYVATTTHPRRPVPGCPVLSPPLPRGDVRAGLQPPELRGLPDDETAEGRGGDLRPERGGHRDANRDARGGDAPAHRAERGTRTPSAGYRKAASRTPRMGRLLSLSSDPGAQSRGTRRRKSPEARKTGSSWPPLPPQPNPALHRLILRGLLPHQWQQSIGSSKKRWRSKAIGVMSQNPFNLRTEQRGKVKVEKLVQRMKKKLLEEERLRNPLAQGLPWTTDEPEVTERSSFLENLNMERERQKLDKENEIKQLRKEQVPSPKSTSYA
ncbi:hypothetical protein ABZP36_026125 [Zizania latifolia]